MTKNNSLLGKTIQEKLKEAEKELTKNGKNNNPSRKENKDKPKLYVSGRLNRKENKCVMKTFSFLKKLDDDIKKYCNGVDGVVLNFLISQGLEIIKKSKDVLHIDVAEIEKNEYNFLTNKEEK